ncbi:MAG: DUF2726 domain-containing protein [Candidatus Saccharimonadales bacterium]
MEVLFLAGFLIVAAAFVNLVRRNSQVERKIRKKDTYTYTAKNLLMSRAESEFFTKIEDAVSERYYVFPQVHLSAILEHRVKGQDWSYAFKHINGKSVDYVLCDKTTLQPMYAIELDDYTHESKDRIERDTEVERIFKQAHLPLVRFANKNVSNEEIIQALVSANSKFS